jgi:hypothetical protein
MKYLIDRGAALSNIKRTFELAKHAFIGDSAEAR